MSRLAELARCYRSGAALSGWGCYRCGATRAHGERRWRAFGWLLAHKLRRRHGWPFDYQITVGGGGR